MNFDMTDRWVRWRLYVYNNRRYDGEIWLAWKTERGLVLAKQSAKVDGELLGEIRTRMIDGEYVHDIVPVQERDAVELAVMARQAEEHKRYRQELYRRYSIGERIRDLKSGG